MVFPRNGIGTKSERKKVKDFISLFDFRGFVELANLDSYRQAGEFFDYFELI
jgi:hypothetical protein